jgi:NADH dehydrogenase
VLVIGGGFAGLSAVQALARSRASVTLVDQNVYSTFQPLLYQVATAGLTSADVAYPLWAATAKTGASFRKGTVASLDLDRRVATLSTGEELGYDYLILATGVSAAFFGVQGAAEYSLSLYTRRDAVTLRNMLLAGYKDSLREYTRQQLDKRGVEVALGTAIKEVRPDSVVLADGTTHHSDITVWAAGIAAPPEKWNEALPHGKGGRIEVGPDLRVAGQERVFSIGDVSISTTDPVAQLSAPAIQQGRHAGRQVRRLLAGQPTTPFAYHYKGIMATIGRRSAVVELRGGLRLRGTIAWFAWLGLHLFYLLGGRNRVVTLVNLAWRYLTWSRGGGVILGDDVPETVDADHR